MNELKVKYEKVSNDLIQFREQNDKLNLTLLQLQQNLQDLTTENRRFDLERNFNENKTRTLNEQLQIANKESRESQLKLENAITKISSLKDEIEQNQKLLLKTKIIF